MKENLKMIQLIDPIEFHKIMSSVQDSLGSARDGLGSFREELDAVKGDLSAVQEGLGDVRGELDGRYGPDNKPTPDDIGAAPAVHTHTPEEVGAAPAVHTHTPEEVGLTAVDGELSAASAHPVSNSAITAAFADATRAIGDAASRAEKMQKLLGEFDVLSPDGRTVTKQTGRVTLDEGSGWTFNDGILELTIDIPDVYTEGHVGKLGGNSYGYTVFDAEGSYAAFTSANKAMIYINDGTRWSLRIRDGAYASLAAFRSALVSSPLHIQYKLAAPAGMESASELFSALYTRRNGELLNAVADKCANMFDGVWRDDHFISDDGEEVYSTVWRMFRNAAECKPGCNYTVAVNTPVTNIRVSCYDANKAFIRTIGMTYSRWGDMYYKTFTTPENTKYINVQIGNSAACPTETMLNEGGLRPYSRYTGGVAYVSDINTFAHRYTGSASSAESLGILKPGSVVKASGGLCVITGVSGGTPHSFTGVYFGNGSSATVSGGDNVTIYY